MKTARGRRSPRGAPSRELSDLRARLVDSEETLRAIGSGEVDAVVVAGKNGNQVFTLDGAEHAYRALIESMNEGALTLTAGKVILYANRCFAQMVKCPLERVMGGSFRRFLSAEDRARLKSLLKGAGRTGTKIQVRLKAGDGSQVPAQISIRPMAMNGFRRATIGVVVTDLTEARRTEELLRALTRRVVLAQESERGRVALELHDHITQLLCAILVRSQGLAQGLAGRDGPLKKAAKELRRMLSQAAREVERISRSLRPGVLEQLGLVAVLQDSGAEFSRRTGLPIKMMCAPLPPRLPPGAELALYRIFQEAIRNVESHAFARHVTVGLRRQGGFLSLAIGDDGIGFDPDQFLARGKGRRGLGLIGMGERAAYVGGDLKIKSVRHAGTEIEVRIPLA